MSLSKCAACSVLNNFSNWINFKPSEFSFFVPDPVDGCADHLGNCSCCFSTSLSCFPPAPSHHFSSSLHLTCLPPPARLFYYSHAPHPSPSPPLSRSHSVCSIFHSARTLVMQINVMVRWPSSSPCSVFPPRAAGGLELSAFSPVGSALTNGVKCPGTRRVGSRRK